MVIMLILVWVSVVKNFVEILCKVCILLFIIEIMVSCFVIVSGFSKFFFSFRQNFFCIVCLVCIQLFCGMQKLMLYLEDDCVISIMEIWVCDIVVKMCVVMLIIFFIFGLEMLNIVMLFRLEMFLIGNLFLLWLVLMSVFGV